MHRVIDITVPSHRGEQLIAALSQLEGVVVLTWQHGASIKPVGDVVTVHALNRATDDVMRAVATIGGDTPFTVLTAEVASISDPENQNPTTECRSQFNRRHRIPGRSITAPRHRLTPGHHTTNPVRHSSSKPPAIHPLTSSPVSPASR